jgi:hypothetical protein
MADALDFTADEFKKMTHEQRIRLCRRLAARARDLATCSAPNQRGPYLRIAAEWETLADEVERLD